MKRPAVVGLGLLNAALVLGLAAIWIDPAGRPRNIHWTAPSAVVPDYEKMLPLLPMKRAVSTDSFLASLERPLFSSTRRPPPPPPPPTPEAPPDVLGSATLVGVYQAEGTTGIIAMVDGKSRRIRVNEMLGSWRLRAVGERSVVFENGGATRELLLARAKMAGGASPASGQSAPPTAAQIPPSVPTPPVAAGGVAPPADAASTASPRRPRFGP